MGFSWKDPAGWVRREGVTPSGMCNVFGDAVSAGTPRVRHSTAELSNRR